MLISHKLARWLVFLAAPPALIGLVLLSFQSRLAAVTLVVALIGILLGAIAMRTPEGKRVPRLVSFCGFVLASHVAGFIAWTKALRGELNPIWEPTRRPG
jgi:hypothetical protein